MDNRKVFITFLQVCCFFVFSGRAWQHLVWDAPFRAFFWDESLMSGVVPLLTGMSWKEYATSPSVDDFINNFKAGLGAFYLMMSMFSLLAHKESLQKIRWLLLVGSSFLFILAILYTKEKFFQYGQLFEYSSQFGSPLLLFLILQKKLSIDRLVILTKALIAITFICHGLYAMGYYPQPGNFVGMVIRITNFPEQLSRSLLVACGWIDFVLAVLIFVPYTARWALLYAAFWGLATAVARLWANFNIDFLFAILNQWTFEVMIRLPHGLLPLMLISPLYKHFELPSFMKRLRHGT